MDGLSIPGHYVAKVGDALARDTREQRRRGEPVAHEVLAVIDGCQAARSESGPIPVREAADPSRWPNTERAARMLGVSRRQVTRLIDRRRLRAIRVDGKSWAIDPESVADYERRRTA